MVTANFPFAPPPRSTSPLVSTSPFYDAAPQENIALNMSELEGDVSTPAPLVQTLDRSPATRLVRSSQTELRNGERRGLLWLLDEEALQPTPSDAGFLQNALDMYSSRGEKYLQLARWGTYSSRGEITRLYSFRGEVLQIAR